MASAIVTVPAIQGTGGLKSLMTAHSYVFAGGYRQSGDNGGGTFYASGSCPTVTVSNATWSAGSQTVAATGIPSTLQPGMYVLSATLGGLYQYDRVVSVSMIGNQIQLELPAFQSSGGTGSVDFSAENGGTVFQDSESPPACFHRASSNFSALEWGAYEDCCGPLSHDDTSFLQNWLDALQAHLATPGNSELTAPLTCSDGGIIQGPPTVGVAASSQTLPSFQITANNGSATGNLFTNSAMLIMPAGARCAIHALGLIGDNSGDFDILHAFGTSDLIDDHSYLSGGNYIVSDVDSPITRNTTTSNLQIYDSSIKDSVAAGLFLHSSGVKISRNSISGAGKSGAAAADIDISPSANAPPPSDILIGDNIIQEAKGWGLKTQGAHLLRELLPVLMTGS
jgi:hypothetical protein